MNQDQQLRGILQSAPILSKYHGYGGFDRERFIADYEAWSAQKRAALTDTQQAAPSRGTVELRVLLNELRDIHESLFGDDPSTISAISRAAALLEASAQRPALKPLTEESIERLADWSNVEAPKGKWNLTFARAVIKADRALNGITGEAQPATDPKPPFNGWYCAHCQRGVDASEVTYHEQHQSCGRVITYDEPPRAQPAEQANGQEPVAHVTVEPLRHDEYKRRVSVNWVKEPVAGPIYTRPQPQADQPADHTEHHLDMVERPAEQREQGQAAGWIRIEHGHTSFVVVEVEWGKDRPNRAGTWMPVFLGSTPTPPAGVSDGWIDSVKEAIRALEVYESLPRHSYPGPPTTALAGLRAMLSAAPQPEDIPAIFKEQAS